jgi:chorismate dehydratase
MSTRPIRIGKINFTNILPIYHFFPHERWADGELEMIPQVPTELNQSMLGGTIDIGPISSFAYGLDQEKYLLYPNLSVSSKGRVDSIFLFLKKPLEDILFGNVALPTTSASSVALLRILLETFHQGKPNYKTYSPDLEKMMLDCDAALLIGDDALVARRNYPSYNAIDLGEEWYRFTGHWMTYAVWAIRREVAEQMPEKTEKLYESFLYSKQAGLGRLDEVIDEAIRIFGGSASFWEKYYTYLNFDFADVHRKGLEYYYEQAYRLDLLPAPAKVEIWQPRQKMPLA